VRSPLITVGVIEVKLLDAAGVPLQLKAGFAATLTYPASSTAAGAASIPLWYHDEVTRVWVRGSSASQQTNGSCLASVTQFTLRDVDFPGVTTPQSRAVSASTLGSDARSAIGLRGRGWVSSTRCQPAARGHCCLVCRHIHRQLLRDGNRRL
jgi:hypothetical protein